MTTESLRTLKVAIAGSTDDGKSTLLGRLLIDSDNVTHDQLEAIAAESRRLARPTPEIAWLTDGLSTEQAKLITIDVAYRTIRWKGWRMQLIDTPGHLEYIQNTATGLSQADALVLLLDISRDFTAQTLRHLLLAEMFAIPHIAVVVNKMDTVGYQSHIFESFVSKFRSAAGALLPASVHFIPASALHGHNVVRSLGFTPWYTGYTLLEHLQHIAQSNASSNRGSDLQPVSFAKIFWISRSPARAGIKVLCGKIEAQNELYIPYKNNQKVIVKEIHHHGSQVEAIHAGQSAVITTEAEVPLLPDEIITDIPLLPSEITVQAQLLQLQNISSGDNYHWITPLRTFPVRNIKTTNTEPQLTQVTEFPKFTSATFEISLFTEIPVQLLQKGLLTDSDGNVAAITGGIQLV